MLGKGAIMTPTIKNEKMLFIYLFICPSHITSSTTTEIRITPAIERI